MAESGSACILKRGRPNHSDYFPARHVHRSNVPVVSKLQPLLEDVERCFMTSSVGPKNWLTPPSATPHGGDAHARCDLPASRAGAVFATRQRQQQVVSIEPPVTIMSANGAATTFLGAATTFLGVKKQYSGRLQVAATSGRRREVFHDLKENGPAHL
eukprot:CAMPEP_0119397470 /NCGR_PEP_ID=MMETSP1334-20130426/140352_1 /TAXON_ID=127549 /ORGANISM="Calcidiscus leptoporus, Strain RCC1130" /LENGTH=156 /DNA_ID=CAMNT_0007421313 /DNA_START=40 /DNA_END=511 /DNA_ORIENTATION=+